MFGGIDIFIYMDTAIKHSSMFLLLLLFPAILLLFLFCAFGGNFDFALMLSYSCDYQGRRFHYYCPHFY